MEVIVLIGLQGAGKSSFVKERFRATHVHVSRDHFRHNPNPSRRQRQLIDEALAEGRSVVVDNTNATRAERAAIIEAARARGAAVIGYFFEPDLRGSIVRNAGRAGKARVPVVGILATRKRMEPPALEEGFDALFHVITRHGEGFGVSGKPALAAG